jgi:hypothetical protein
MTNATQTEYARPNRLGKEFIKRRWSLDPGQVLSKQYKHLNLNCHEERMHSKFSFPNIVFKLPVALIYHLFHKYFRLKYTLLYSHPSTLHGSAVYGHHQCLLSW